jgi:DNA-binding transcriptional MerR regulator
MKQAMCYTIGELARLAGVTPRTIRYYTAEGLLPPPETRGRYALYSEDHLRRLRLIGRLKDAYLPLAEIKARLDQLTPQQVQELLDAYGQEADRAPGSALEYIAQVLAGRSAPPAPHMLAESSARYEAAPAAPPAAHALPLHDSEADAGGQPAPAMPVAPPPIVPTDRAGSWMAAAPVRQPSLLRKLIPHQRERSEPVQQIPTQARPGEPWQRVTLAPGVELHVREPVAAEVRERLERLIAFVGELFADVRDQG